jgi:hypothetical protein
MGRHRRIEEGLDDGLDPVARLDELEKALVETLAEVTLGRQGSTYPWDAERHGRHAGPAVVDLRDRPDDHAATLAASDAVAAAAAATSGAQLQQSTRLT